MKKLFLLFLVFILNNLSANASGWQQADKNVYIYIKSIMPYYNELHEIMPNKYSFWTRYFNDGSEYFKNYEKTFDTKISITHVRYVIDCADKTISTKATMVYDDKSRILEKTNLKTKALKAEEIKPNTPADNFYKNVCK